MLILPQALGLLVEVQGRRFAHRAPAVLRLVLGVLRGHEAAVEAEDVEELRAEQLLGGGGEADGGADGDAQGGANPEPRDSVVVARGWQEAYAALVLFEKVGQQVSLFIRRLSSDVSSKSSLPSCKPSLEPGLSQSIGLVMGLDCTLLMESAFKHSL